MNVEQMVEWGLAGEADVVGESSPQYHFFGHMSHDLTLDRTRTAEVGSRRLIASAMARSTSNGNNAEHSDLVILSSF
jgi:hypothetical protein